MKITIIEDSPLPTLTLGDLDVGDVFGFIELPSWVCIALFGVANGMREYLMYHKDTNGIKRGAGRKEAPVRILDAELIVTR